MLFVEITVLSNNRSIYTTMCPTCGTSRAIVKGVSRLYCLSCNHKIEDCIKLVTYKRERVAKHVIKG